MNSDSRIPSGILTGKRMEKRDYSRTTPSNISFPFPFQLIAQNLT